LVIGEDFTDGCSPAQGKTKELSKTQTSCGNLTLEPFASGNLI
jgi:hypothetical protein